MNSFTNNELSRISNTLEDGAGKETNYYVYMLAIKNEKGDICPFYIGKGKGTRVFQHEDDAENVIKAIEDVRDTKLYKEESDKIKKIISNKGEVYKYIIKWGLTSQEAFMCESSVINMYSYLFPGVLTNIQNGHVSDKEKNSKIHTTKMYEISDFLKQVCIEEVCYEDTELVNKKCMFIPIEKALTNYDEDCSKKKQSIDYEDYVYQCVQGYKKYNVERANLADYVIALQNTIVRGVFPVAKWMSVVELRNSDAAPQYPIDSRDKDKAKKGDFLKRIGFIKIEESDLTVEQQNELSLIKSQVLNKLIKEKESTDKKDWFKEQNKTYNYDIKNGKCIIREKLR